MPVQLMRLVPLRSAHGTWLAHLTVGKNRLLMQVDIRGELKDIVVKRTVHYQVWRHHEFHEGNRVMVGFDLELYGTHDHGKTHLSPGCHLCQETFADLARIAQFILPKDERPSRYDIPPFDHSLHSSPKGTFEVVLPIRIEHREKFFDPIDSCEERCLKEMLGRLAEFGVQGGHL